MKGVKRTTFGQQLRSYRKAAGLTQEALAARLNVDARTIRDWQSDRHRPRAWMVELLIDVLEVPEDEHAHFRAAAHAPREEVSSGDIPESVPGTSVNELVAPSQEAPQTNLPRERTSFVGREREMAEIAGLLEHSRLLTLTGPGGVGKTRLTVQIAAERADQYSHGVRCQATIRIFTDVN